MKAKFEFPEIEVIMFVTEDIITTSTEEEDEGPII